MKSGFLKDYLQELQDDQALATAGADQGHEVPIHGEVNTISRTTNIRYLVVNAPSAYNILLGRPALNRIRAIASTRHMKMKLSSLEDAVITIKSDQKEAKKCYENSLKTKRWVFSFTTKSPKEDGVTRVEIARENRPEPAGDVVKREIGGKTFKLGWF